MLEHGRHVLLTGLDEALGVIHFRHDNGLALLEIFSRNDVVQVGIDQLLLLPLERNEPLPLAGEKRFIVRLLGFQLFAACLAHLRNGLGSELHLAVPNALHLLLDEVSADIWQITFGAPGVASDAEEVAVHATASL